MWQAHLRGEVNEQYRLWIVLMFQAWLEQQQPTSAGQSQLAAKVA
jgi:hypothetical protein